jgi:hypothetical protein
MQNIITLLQTEPAIIYHSQRDKYLSSHQLIHFMRCPYLWYKQSQGLIPDSQSTEFLIGQASHTRILEGRSVYESQFVWDSPVNPTTGQPYHPSTKKYADWKKAQHRIVLTRTQAGDIEDLARGVALNENAVELLSDGVAEGVLRAEYGGVRCQIRLDWYNPKYGFVDLKTCKDLDYFEYDAKKYNYHHQFAFYQAVIHALTGQYLPVHVIAVEKKEPYRCGVWWVSPETLTAARAENEAAIGRWKQCLKDDCFPTGFETVRTLIIL